MGPLTIASNPSKSYSHIAQKCQVPTKNQAIVVDAIEGHTVPEYAIAFGKLIDSHNILFISRISHGRVCVYLNSDKLVDQLTEKKTNINIGTNTLEIRPLISKAKRIILSNVCPVIPNTIIEEELQRLDITPVSQLTPIKAGINMPGFTHILSFRRQMYIKPEDVEKIPENMQINVDNTTYWIYLSTEKLTCFLCKEEGHLAKYCKNTELSPKTTPTMNTTDSNSTNQTIKNNREEKNKPTVSQTTDHLVTSLPITMKKRPLSTTTSSTSSQDQAINNDAQSKSQDKAKNLTKKPKTLSTSETRPKLNTIELEHNLQPVKEYISTSKTEYCLDFENFLSFMINTYGNSNITEIAQRYTNDLTALHNMLSDVYGHIQERHLKSRITKMKKRLLAPQSIGTEINSQDGSSSSDESNFT